MYYLDRNKMFPARVMQEYTSPDDDTTMGKNNRVEHLHAESTPFSSGEPSSSTNKASVLTAQQKVYQIFRKNQNRLKSQPYFELLNERKKWEPDHTVTLDSGKVVLESDNPINYVVSTQRQ